MLNESKRDLNKIGKLPRLCKVFCLVLLEQMLLCTNSQISSLCINCKLASNDTHRGCVFKLSTQQRLWFWFWFSVSSL